MTLHELLTGLVWVQADDRVISGIELDSRKVVEGNVFVALTGAMQHGLNHLGQAVNNGACAVIFDPAGQGQQLADDYISFGEPEEKPPMIAIANLGGVIGIIAARFYGNPSQLIDVIGITGTNGKTSCSQFLGQLLDDCGIIGTLGWGEWGKLDKTVNTTPDALSVQQMLAALMAGKKQTVAMEVSSHGLEQGRVNGVRFKGAVFTNISRDHLDYHGTMEAYLQAKLALLDKPGLAFVVVNLDDATSGRIIAEVPKTAVVWGVSVNGKVLTSGGESLVAQHIVHKPNGIEFDVRWRTEHQQVTVPLYGDFNIENVLVVLAVMLAMGIGFAQAVNRLAQIKPVAGRMERFGGDDGRPLVIVDYAHTPDALEKVLSSVRKHCQRGLWVVFGCGGDRDAGKRPMMGRAAEQWADHLIITDDNPRFENNQAIINDILAGCHSNKIEVIQDRAQAIQSAVTRAAKNDCIVIAGKGHEDYQDVAGVKFPFSDREIVIEALNCAPTLMRVK
ncbi:MAG: UDP-N-acetylmuramoyl-L-alanyl-D-glutamate--2,6-diaminopimelate ligase [Methylovulum sp.]|nr:UDP-N-acetylmuramoyl-L-alanyl-D-glutamate--2,6-diaminopimelate ligase [Methylovulum sp.]